ncbi:M14 family metallopeptidase [Thalassotalea aquiviva]|uniref:M14 family metallopeptidase n=1 Tax=Thalassotalea aquiviva TaxID=3242415 RepID=UPI00352A36B3
MNIRLNIVGLLLSSLLLSKHTIADDTLLPPIKEFSGASLGFMQTDNGPWQTPAEALDLFDTPNYQQTFAYVTKLVDSDPRLHLLSLGKSPQQRDIWMLVASSDGATTAEQLQQNNKPTLLIQAGIHAGEIDGKDAGLMLLRDIIKGDKAHLLNKVNVLFIPILNVDGHERISVFNRVNQRGPWQMGWRTNAQNLNLNRDYAKIDTPELQHLIRMINTWQPDLYFDIHVTDGEDYQYDLTYGFNGHYADSPNISNWLEQTFRPKVDQDLLANGHLPSPLVFGLEKKNFAKGLYGWTAGVRFSNGWGDTRHLPTILVENHSLKPYKQRVLATYVFLQSAIELLAQQHTSLIQATEKDQAQRPKKQTLAWDLDFETPEKADFLGIDYQVKTDPITGIEYVDWTGKDRLYKDLPTYWARKPAIVVDVPKAYYVPIEHQQVIERLSIHGIEISQVASLPTNDLFELSAKNSTFASAPFEGHLTVKATFTENNAKPKAHTTYVKVSTDQPLGRLAVALLDPRGPDSFFSWGFFNQMFQRTEYIESYVVAPLARRMLMQDSALKQEFEQAFPKQKQAVGEHKDNLQTNADSDQQRMQWFYQRSKYHDSQYLKYPVLIEK